MSRFPLFPSETREARVGEQVFIVRRFGIVTTPVVVYEAWERAGDHATQTYDESRGCWIGKVTTRPNPPEVDAIPAGTQQRIGAVEDLLHELRVLSVRAIEVAFPDVMAQPHARATQGRVETRENDPDVSPVAVSREDRDLEAAEEFGGGR